MNRKKVELSEILDKIKDASVRQAILNVIIEIVKANESREFSFYNNYRALLDVTKKIMKIVSTITALKEDGKISFELEDTTMWERMDISEHYVSYTEQQLDLLTELLEDVGTIVNLMCTSKISPSGKFNDLIEKRKQESLEAGGKW